MLVQIGRMTYWRPIRQPDLGAWPSSLGITPPPEPAFGAASARIQHFQDA